MMKRRWVGGLNGASVLVVLLLVVVGLSGCSHWKPLKAPCTYNKRSNCGPVIPLQ